MERILQGAMDLQQALFVFFLEKVGSSFFSVKAWEGHLFVSDLKVTSKMFKEIFQA